MGSNSNKKAIVQKTPPSTTGKGRVDLVKSDFDAAIVQKGYDVYLDKAIWCPCRRTGDHQALSSCQNCGGSGYVYINRYKTKMILQSMNLNTKFKEWSEEKIGTVSVTALDEDNIAYMDRIVVLDAEIITSQVVFPKEYNSEVKVKLIYDITGIEEIFAFQGDDKKLVKLELNTDYSYLDNIIVFDNKYSTWENFTVSVRYRHAPTFHVIDMVRETMTTTIKTGNGPEKSVVLPINAIARRSHYVIDEQDYDGLYLLDNSYDEVGCGNEKDEIIPPPKNFNLYHEIYTEVVLSWVDPSDSETNFIVQRSGIDGKWEQVAVLPANSTTFTDTNVVSGEIYFYRAATRKGTKQSVWAGVLGVTVLPPVACPDANVLFQGNPTSTPVPSGGTVNFRVVDSQDNDSGTLVTDTALEKKVQVAGGTLYVFYNRPYLNQTVSYADWDEAYLRGNGYNDYNNNIPANAALQEMDETIPNLDLLKYENIHGHKQRFSGINGGYYDKATSQYKDVNGNVSTQDAEFPVDFGAVARIIYDHLTGIMYLAQDFTAGSWTDLMAAIPYDSTTGGGTYADWLGTPMVFYNSLANYEFEYAFGAVRPPFTATQSTHWSVTNAEYVASNAKYFHHQHQGAVRQAKTGFNRWFFHRIFGTGTIPQSTSNTYVYYKRFWLTQVVSYADYDEAWRKGNGGNDYLSNLPEGVLIQEIEPDFVNGRYDYLKYKNVYGHRFRWTGVNGGYYDEADSTYRDVNGNLSDFATEFPTVVGTTSFVKDHLTGFMHTNNRLGACTWDDNLSTLPTYEVTYGVSFIAPTVTELMTKANTEVDVISPWTNLSTNRPFVVDDQGTHWSGTTSPNNSIQALTYFSNSLAIGFVNASTKNTTGRNRCYYNIFSEAPVLQ